MLLGIAHLKKCGAQVQFAVNENSVDTALAAKHMWCLTEEKRMQV